MATTNSITGDALRTRSQSKEYDKGYELAFGNKNKCDKCGTRPAKPEHTCPYQADIHGDYDFTCNCCPGCEHECCMDI